MFTQIWSSLSLLLLSLSLIGIVRSDVWETTGTSVETINFHSVMVSETKYVYIEPEGVSSQMVGMIRYHYDKARSTCSHVLLIGVGTFMSVADYDNLSQAIAIQEESSVVVITDHNVGNFQKTSPYKYASLANAVASQLNILIPICTLQTTPIVLLGGHSASGQAVMQAWQHKLFDVSIMNPIGIIGLDPYEISKETINETATFDLPGLYWGFTKTTCLVSIQKAAKAAYNITMTSARVLYTIHNEKDGCEITHCVFTDHGCGIWPMSCSMSTSLSWVYGQVAQSVRFYVQALSYDRPFTHGSFVLPVPKTFHGEIDVFVNENQ